MWPAQGSRKGKKKKLPEAGVESISSLGCVHKLGTLSHIRGGGTWLYVKGTGNYNLEN